MEYFLYTTVTAHNILKLQPIDIAINKPMKHHLQTWYTWYRIWQNFRGEKLSQFFSQSWKFSPWIICCVQYIMAWAWCTAKVFQWIVCFVHNRESFPPRKFCRIRYVFQTWYAKEVDVSLSIVKNPSAKWIMDAWKDVEKKPEMIIMVLGKLAYLMPSLYSIMLNKNTWGVKKVRGQEEPATKSSDIK